MKISIITVFPEIHDTFLKTSIIGRAVEKQHISINIVRFSDFCQPKERIDEATVGHGSGMIIKPEVIEHAIESCEQAWGPGFKIFFSPQGIPLTQPVLKNIASMLSLKMVGTPASGEGEGSAEPHIILLCPRYEGIDQRVEEYYADATISIGDYVLMGGDIPAQVFLEGFLRLIPGIVGKQESVEKESFSGPFLDHPEYGLPVTWKNLRIPEIAQSGNHAAIDAWRQQEAAHKTILNRFDWFRSAQPHNQEIAYAQKYIPPHYVALMHTNVKLKDGTIGNTSVTSIDLHDTARSCATYGVKNFFMVSPLIDQQKIMATFLEFWQSPAGKEYNWSRHHAVSKVVPTSSFDDVITKITQQEGIAPLVIATSAKKHAHSTMIDYHAQGDVWKRSRPVLFLFGTGQGLEEAFVEKCDYLLLPVEGMTGYNHLSVRSAIAVILDRWLGLQPKLKQG